MKAEQLKARGFIPHGISGEWNYIQGYKTITVILGRYESIEIYDQGRLQAAFPVNSIHQVDQVCFDNGIYFKTKTIENANH